MSTRKALNNGLSLSCLIYFCLPIIIPHVQGRAMGKARVQVQRWVKRFRIRPDRFRA
jgi:hypothetical protein